MSIRRFLYRRRCLLTLIQFFTIFFFFRVVQLSLFTNNLDGNVYVTNLQKPVTKHDVTITFQIPAFNASHHADIYTYDLPDVTRYDYVSGKRFKEYVIPVKDIDVAYRQNLDPLEVFLIPFSHVDPGYGLTLESYYQRMSKHTLDNMVKKLNQYPDLTFQWAETIFLERWWRDISETTKQNVRELIQDGRFEILSGGWVMPDEAVTHFAPVIDQLIEGHQWLWENLGVKPENNWANDPFGYSSTFPYLWKKSGMENMVILRINQAMKGTLMKKQALEFTWKPLWSKNSTNDILCHLMPYRGYWIGDTCGPYNQHICREYAFMHTNPRDKVVFVTDDNLAERARILYEQYRITAELYRRDNLNANGESVSQNLYLPIFLGEDFSYVSGNDYDLIYKNYKKLFDYMNSKKEWNIQLKFGTIGEYFNKIKHNQEKRTAKDGSRFPSLSGDFMPYTDYQKDFWTGYYSTRPFIKQLSRELQSSLKMADIFHAYAHAQAESSENVIAYTSYAEVTSLLRAARRDLGMFLHHDGITGTSVTPVINDFRKKIYVALRKTESAIKLIISQLLTFGHVNGLEVFKNTVQRMSMTSIPRDVVMDMSVNFKAGGSFLVVTNPSARKRTDVISFTAVARNKYTFISSAEGPLDFQTQSLDKDNTTRFSFVVDLPPYSLQTFRVESFKTKKNMSETDVEEDVLEQKETQSDQQRNDTDIFVLENAYLYVEIDEKSGFPRKLKMKNDDKSEIDVLTEVLAYDSLRSGAYIFAPKGAANPFISGKPEIVVNKGTYISEIKSIYRSFTLTTRVYNVTGVKGMGVHLTAEFDMTKEKANFNKELILRFKTSINNENIFFTDQNSFQLIGRKTRAEHTEENYYPITSMVVIEDQDKRLTLHTAQPHGAASLENGWMEVMLDRRVARDDDKGLGQGVLDNTLTVANFILQVETRKENQEMPKELKYTYPSETNILMNELLNEPTYSLFVEEGKKLREFNLNEDVLSFTSLENSLPCGVSVVGMRTLSKSDLSYNGTSLVLHYTPTLNSLKETSLCSNRGDEVTLKHLFRSFMINSAKETSLTHLNDIKKINLDDNLRPAEMELRSFKVSF
ncbi:alpha-mannosidase 2-like isoform X2 [Ruditapes philippinarum]|nr:alpha-mannosidase 2-like isoform X2 [Ruditapes philippinarum]